MAAAIAALTAAGTAFFGIKVAVDQANRSAETARQALKVAGANSTSNGNPNWSDF